MKSYKIYLTKSREAAVLLANGLSANKKDPNQSTGWGYADGANFLPPMYKGLGYFYAAVWYESDKPTCELVIC